MNLPRLVIIGAAAGTAMLSTAQESQTLRAVKERHERGTLSDQRELVRGDSGKWRDAARLQVAPSIQRKSAGVKLDDWADELAEAQPPTKATDDNWLIFRTRQLDDNDRVWIERIERSGNTFTVTMHQAIWQGKYFKTFTYYEVTAVNLGKLPPGAYTVKWIVKPFTFKQLEKPREAVQNYQTNWPVDDQPTRGKAVELKAELSVQ